MKPFQIDISGRLILFFFAWAQSPFLWAGDLVVPVPAIPGGAVSAIYQVTVNGKDVPVNDESRYDFHTALFTMDGNVEVKVRLPKEATTCEVLPSRFNIVPKIENNTATFSLSQPLNLVIKTKGQLPLVLLISPLEVNPPKESSATILYFPPGIHDAGVIRPISGQTIYLAPGALVKGRIEAKNVKNVTVKGRGILDASEHSVRKDKTCAILFENSSHITVEGIGCRGGTWWQTLFLLTNDVEAAYMNLFGKAVNTDGIDIDGVKNLVARNCFIRCGDDGFGWHAVDAKNNGEPVTENCLAEDCVIWNSTAGNGLRVGASMETGLFQNITFRNIDVLSHVNAAICSDHSDWTWCKNIRFENFNDESGSSQFVDIAIAKTRYSNDTNYKDERGHYEGLYFINLKTLNGKISLKGFDREHLIDKVSFQNCQVGKKLITRVEDLSLNEYVTNISFSTEPAAKAP